MGLIVTIPVPTTSGTVCSFLVKSKNSCPNTQISLDLCTSFAHLWPPFVLLTLCLSPCSCLTALPCHVLQHHSVQLFFTSARPLSPNCPASPSSPPTAPEPQTCPFTPSSSESCFIAKNISLLQYLDLSSFFFLGSEIDDMQRIT